MNQSTLSSKVGRVSETLLNLAFPPIIVYKVIEMASLVIGPSCGVNLFLFPGFKTTTVSLPL
jgi:hypothetical protein